MLVGGVLVDPLLSGGYAYRPQHIFSPDGHCRPFSDDAGGTIGGSGVGVVVLKPLRLARADGDTVYSVITGSAINNDGSAKLSYGAPALAGQREVIRAALRRSGRGSDELGYVEAHGTGTRLGDPVEVGALRQAYDLAGSGQVRAGLGEEPDRPPGRGGRRGGADPRHLRGVPRPDPAERGLRPAQPRTRPGPGTVLHPDRGAALAGRTGRGWPR